ncbi:MAG: arylsulfatase A-like enzyme [Chlamydiales bacterium]|jgi:arylsulfatase A-like enzyme
MKTLIWVPLLASLAASCPGPRARPGIPAQHLLLVTVAGLRADHTSAWQYHRPTTYTEIDGGLRAAGRAVALDDLAAEGVMFAHTFAPSGDTDVALASMLTGCSPLETGIMMADGARVADKVSLAQALRAAGYRTAAFVTGETLAGASWEAGFDVFQRGETDRDTLGNALDWAGAHDFGNGQQVLLWVHLEQPTFPFSPTEMDATLERGGVVDFAHLFTDPDYAGSADGSDAFRSAALSPGSARLEAADRDQVIALYDGDVAQADRLLQLFLDFYRYAGASNELWERTFLVLAGVGGVELFEAGARDSRSWGETGRLSDAVLHVPLLMRHPDSLTGRRIFDHVTELQDLLPTVLEWAQVARPDGLPGRSLLRITDRAGSGFVARAAFGCRGSDGQIEALTARDERWRLIWTPAAEHPLELIDQVADPLALDNLADQRPDVVERLRAQLDAWLESGKRRPGLDLTAFGQG